jgi:hypothetical protein
MTVTSVIFLTLMIMMGLLTLLILQGRVKRVGMSNYHADEMKRAFALCREHGWTSPSVYQGHTLTHFKHLCTLTRFHRPTHELTLSRTYI